MTTLRDSQELLTVTGKSMRGDILKLHEAFAFIIIGGCRSQVIMTNGYRKNINTRELLQVFIDRRAVFDSNGVVICEG